MGIRTATEKDLNQILALGQEFGHLMSYQKDLERMQIFLPWTLVYEVNGKVEGYFSYVSPSFPGWREAMICYKQIPPDMVEEAVEIATVCSFACLMQGGSHREVFTELIKEIQKQFDCLWCYCSIVSKRPQTYEKLGFSFDHSFSFWNINKGDFSTYRLGEWSRLTCESCEREIRPRPIMRLCYLEESKWLCARCQDLHYGEHGV